MSPSGWWQNNGKYFTAWAAHLIVLMLLSTSLLHVSRYIQGYGPPPETLNYWTSTRMISSAVTLITLIAASLFAFRFFVLKLIILREPWSAQVQQHPYKPYVMAWFIYTILSLGIDILIMTLLGSILVMIPGASTVIRYLVAFFVFRMAVRKYVLPRVY